MSTYLWQNFLRDRSVQQRISNQARLLYEQYWCDCVIEIGPGKWAITKHLVKRADRVVAIEKDTTLDSSLSWLPIQVIFSDVLDVDISDFIQQYDIIPEKTIIIGNLPYYITSPILRKFFGEWEQPFPTWLFMMQKEVGEKIATNASKKSFLWRLLNYGNIVSYKKTVPAKAFNPPPNVQSCMIQIEKKDVPEQCDFQKMFTLLDHISWYKRKTLNKIWKMIHKDVSTAQTYTLPSDIGWKRIEQLDRDDMNKLINLYLVVQTDE